MTTWHWIAVCMAAFGFGGATATFMNLRLVRKLRRDRIGGYLR